LRSRSRKLEFDNDFMRRYLDLAETNIVGETAPRLVSLVDNAPGSPDTGARTAIVNSWAEWGKPGVCEVSGITPGPACARRLCAGPPAMAKPGAAEIRQAAAGNKWGYSLQLLDVDRLATWLNRTADGTQNAIVAGVEINPNGRPVAYHFNTGQMTASSARNAERVPADAVLHRFIPQRPNSAAGFRGAMPRSSPCTTPASSPLSALVAAKHGADHLGFFVSPDGSAPPIGTETADEDGSEGARIATSAAGTWDTIPTRLRHPHRRQQIPQRGFWAVPENRESAHGQRPAWRQLPGVVQRLRGREFLQHPRCHPECARRVAQAPELVCRRLARTDLRRLAAFLIAQRRHPARQRRRLPIIKADKFAAHAWQFRGWAWVDPLKDVETAREGIALRITSRSRIAREQGRDIEEIFDDLQTEEALARQYGIDLTAPPATPLNPKQEQLPA
jgi:hypothetical protein